MWLSCIFTAPPASQALLAGAAAAGLMAWMALQAGLQGAVRRARQQPCQRALTGTGSVAHTLLAGKIPPSGRLL